MTKATAPPGWYADPAGGSGQRYFDGAQWADDHEPLDQPALVQQSEDEPPDDLASVPDLRLRAGGEPHPNFVQRVRDLYAPLGLFHAGPRIDPGLVCYKCHGTEVRVEVLRETKHRGIFMWIVWIVVAIMTCGIFLLFIPLVMNSKSGKLSTVAVCQRCGTSWALK